jgi:drug/metabolite transporter (DMT)-like permease
MSAVVLLSVCAAVTYGLSDFVGGMLTRRTSAWAVATASQAAATVLAVVFASFFASAPSTDTLAWGALAGVGGGAGNVLIYRGLGSGRMTVVAPVSALAAAALPVIVGIAGGDRPGIVPLAGVALALPAVWLVAGGGLGVRRDATHDGGRARDFVNGLGAGLGFGVQFSALGQIPADAGLIPLVLCQIVSVTTIVVAAAVLRAPWMPRDRYSRLGVVAGILAGIATIAFQFATQSGMLTIAGVLTSLYPTVTVVLAAVWLRETIRRAQGLGLGFAATAIVLIAAG